MRRYIPSLSARIQSWMHLRLLSAAAVVALTGALAVPSASLASCVIPNYAAHMANSGNVVLAGTLLEVGPQQITVAVLRWWGEGAAPSVVVQRPPTDPNAITSVDWNPHPGEAYVILARRDGAVLSTRACEQLPGTPQTAHEVEVALGAGITPGGTVEPTGEEVEPAGSGMLPFAFVGLAVLGAIAVVLAITRLRRPQ